MDSRAGSDLGKDSWKQPQWGGDETEQTKHRGSSRSILGTFGPQTYWGTSVDLSLYLRVMSTEGEETDFFVLNPHQL